MSISQIRTVTFSVYGDGTSVAWSVDLADYLPGIAGITLIEAYTTASELVEISPGSFQNYTVATALPAATLTGSVLSVILPSAPPQWLAPYAGPAATPVVFSVTVSY